MSWYSSNVYHQESYPARYFAHCCILHTVHYTLHITHYTLYTVRFKQHTTHIVTFYTTHHTRVERSRFPQKSISQWLFLTEFPPKKIANMISIGLSQEFSISPYLYNIQSQVNSLKSNFGKDNLVINYTYNRIGNPFPYFCISQDLSSWKTTECKYQIQKLWCCILIMSCTWDYVTN